MSIKGFSINGRIERYDYDALDNKPTIPEGGGDGLTEEIKQALLQLATKVAYIDSAGQTYYDDLYDALYAQAKTLTSISATFSQTSTIYTTDSVSSIPTKGALVVVGNYSDSSTSVISSGYTLSGNLTAGTTPITVSYQGKTTTFNVTVTAVSGTFTITNSLSHCTTNNSSMTITDGGSYTATITADLGYTLTGAAASVTMGGQSVTGAYSNGYISIPNVTGDIVITVVAAARTLSSISAVYTQSGTVYATDSLDSLKADLVVTATYSDSTTAVVPSNSYTLNGTLAEGTSTITVSYGGQATTFNVVVTVYTTSPRIAYHDQGIVNDGSLGAATGACVTEYYYYEIPVEDFKGTDYYDATNNYATAASTLFRVNYYISKSTSGMWSGKNKVEARDSAGTHLTYWTPTHNAVTTSGNPKENSNFFTLTDNIIGLRWTLSEPDIDNSYAYWIKADGTGLLPVGVDDGDIIFAGSGTPYYGKKNISEANV